MCLIGSFIIIGIHLLKVLVLIMESKIIWKSDTEFIIMLPNVYEYMHDHVMNNAVSQ